jgi:hypothetical protein
LLTLPGSAFLVAIPWPPQTRRSIPRHLAFRVCSTTTMDGQNNGSAQVTYDGHDI